MCSFRSEINDHTILILDNFDSHVSAESFSYVEEELSSEISALLPNSTSICQPLDVGVMGPFKQIIRRMWLTDKNRPDTAEEKRKATIMRAIRAWNEISPDIGSHHSKKQFQRYFMFKFLFCMV